MSLFASKRERRLWLWTFAVIAIIYVTLGLAQTLAQYLRNQELLSNTIWLGLFLIGTAIFFLGLKGRPGGLEIGVALGVAGAYVVALLRLVIPEERSHLIEYSIVALFIYEALVERASHGRRVPAPALFAILATTIVGTVDEVIQAFLPSRVFDIRDIGFNLIAAVMAVSGSAALHWARNWAEARRSITKK